MPAFLCFLFFLLSSATACDRCVDQAKVSYFSKDSVLSTGACEYGSLALGFNGGYLAAGVPSLYKGGAGCGACFQMRCESKSLCTSKGTKFILTDRTHNNETDFVLSRKAFKAMAKKGKGKHILKLRVLDVEYKRIPCEYKKHNLSIRVEESSNKSEDYLAVKLLYQGGQTEITGIIMSPDDSPNRIDLSRKNSAVWDCVATLPKEALRFAFVFLRGFDVSWYWTEAFFPVDWKPGMIYDSGIQIPDIIQERCPDSDCDPKIWK